MADCPFYLPTGCPYEQPTVASALAAERQFAAILYAPAHDTAAQARRDAAIRYRTYQHYIRVFGLGYRHNLDPHPHWVAEARVSFIDAHADIRLAATRCDIDDIELIRHQAVVPPSPRPRSHANGQNREPSGVAYMLARHADLICRPPTIADRPYAARGLTFFVIDADGLIKRAASGSSDERARLLDDLLRSARTTVFRLADPAIDATFGR